MQPIGRVLASTAMLVGLGGWFTNGYGHPFKAAGQSTSTAEGGVLKSALTGVPTCSMVRVALKRPLLPVMSQDGAFFGLTNVSRSRCELDGYPVVQVYAGRSGAFLNRVVRSGNILFNNPGAHMVIIEPHQAAYFGFSWPTAGEPHVRATGCTDIVNVFVMVPKDSVRLETTVDFGRKPLTAVCKGTASVTAIAMAESFQPMKP
jgi:hypothetical protein